MIVIIDGADLVGKSTAAERLSDDEGWPIVKIRWDLVGDPAVETRAMAKATTAMLAALNPDVVFDRSFLSWWAYGPVLGHQVEFMPALAQRLGHIRDLYVVLLTASEPALRNRYDIEPDAWFSIDQIIAANDRIPSVASLLPENVPNIHIDTSATSPADVYNLMRDFLGSAKG